MNSLTPKVESLKLIASRLVVKFQKTKNKFQREGNRRTHSHILRVSFIWQGFARNNIHNFGLRRKELLEKKPNNGGNFKEPQWYPDLFVPP
jgi:hypothetical protein